MTFFYDFFYDWNFIREVKKLGYVKEQKLTADK